MSLADQTSLECVRLHFKRTPAEATVARSRLSNLLASVSLRPPAMPPSAILLVREMADPLPGQITGGLAPGALASAEWEAAAQRRLDEFYRSAARPMRERTPADVAAVVFADYAELLACMARDFASGTASMWWWRAFARRIATVSAGSWVAAWVDQPRYIPAALSYLDAHRQAGDVLRRITPDQSWTLLTVLSRACEVPWVAARSGGPRRPPALPEPRSIPWQTENTAHDLAARTAGGDASSPAPTRLPWEPYVSWSTTPSDLGYERQTLLGIGLLLHRAPRVAAAAAFGLRLRAWLNVQACSRADVGSSTALRREQPPQPAGAWRDVADHATVDRDAEPRQPGPPRRADARSPREITRLPTINRYRGAREFALAERSRSSIVGALGAPDQPVEYRGEIEASVPPRAWETGEATRAGGILFLVHLLRRAALLRNFDTGLGGWALIELLGRCLLEDDGVMARDAIWAALARLDGRGPGTPPGLGFTPSRTYVAPPAWLEGDVGPSRFARFRSRGLEIWTGEEFLVFDTEATERPSDAPRRITPSRRRALRRPAAVRPLGLCIAPPLRRFLHFVLPYARWRLGRALGGFSLRQALSRAGMLYVTATHVDLVMSLNQISVPVRLAGLDANPGWVPELSRVVTFHFEREAPAIA